MLKILSISILIIILIAAGAIFIYRYQIFQYSAESIIRQLLPAYINIDKINFDLKNNRVILTNFKILNPEGFSNRYLLEISDITCSYRMKGKSILDGIEALEPSLNRLTLNIERLANGQTNLGQMKEHIEKAEMNKAPVKDLKRRASISGVAGNKKISDVLKLPETFSLRNGKIIFIDRLGQARPIMFTFENMNSDLGLKLNDSYTGILSLASKGTGDVNGNRGEVVNWDIGLDPTTPKLTMSSRFDVSNVNMMPLEPYYDRYSPLVFKTGRFSGTLIFDFDNGNIGSNDEVHLSDIKFSIKPGYENAQFWETTVPDLVKYFSSSSGEIIFDFKIKGDMSSPKFYLGPISKQALTSMAIDKISSAIQQASGPAPAPGAPKSDIQKAKEYIDLFKGMVNKK